MKAAPLRLLGVILLPAAMLVGGCAPATSVASRAASPASASAVAPSPRTAAPLAGARSGVLSNVHSLCSNQFPGVQMWGTLSGDTYDVVIGQPGMEGTYSQVLETVGPESQTSTLTDAWVASTSNGVISYSSAKGAAFKIQTTPDPMYYGP